LLVSSCLPKPLFLVTFDSQGGSAVETQTVEEGELLTAPTAPTKEGSIFAGWYKETGGINPWNFASDTVTADITLYAKWELLEVGDNYGGGIVAYIFKDNGDNPDDPGYVMGETHGLIAATEDQSDGIVWITGGDTIITLNGGTSAALGTGATNTAAIIAQAEAASNDNLSTYAAGIYANYINTDNGTGVFDDWFLPSKDELNKLYLKKEEIGGFANLTYWSSSEYSALLTVWYHCFENGSQDYDGFKIDKFGVRAVRYF